MCPPPMLRSWHDAVAYLRLIKLWTRCGWHWRTSRYIPLSRSDHKLPQDRGLSGKLATVAAAQLMAAPLGNSIEGLLALLSESDDSLKAYALEQINASVHHFWHQASGSLATIEALHEDVDF